GEGATTRVPPAPPPTERDAPGPPPPPMRGGGSGRPRSRAVIRFTAIRLVEIMAMLVLMSFVIYALMWLMPGDPIDLMRQSDPRMTAADVARLKAVYGVNQPLVMRWGAWAAQALQ